LLQFQITTDMFGNKAPFTDAGLKVQQRRSNRSRPAHRSSTRRALHSDGQPWQMDLNMPFHIFSRRTDWIRV